MGGGVAALVALIALEAGWLAFDGAHAILTGDYVTPSTGPHAGQLGPWAALVRAIGVDPRSTGMNAFFLAYGGYGWWQARRWRHDCPGGRAVLTGLASGALWYLSFRTLLSAVGFRVIQVDQRAVPAEAPR